MDGLKIFSGNAGKKLAEDTCKLLFIEPGDAIVGKFGDGEVRVKIKDNVRGADVYIINPTNAPAENLIELAFLTSAARDSSAERITMVIPYMGYNRQDRKDQPRVPISAKIIIDMLRHRGAKRVLLFDLHSEATAAHFHPLVVDHLYLSYIGVPYLRELLTEPFVVAAPDVGAGKRMRYFAKALNQSRLAIFDKERADAGVIKNVTIVGDVDGMNVLFVDDIADSCGTLQAVSAEAKRAGAKDIFAFVSFGIFSGDAFKRIADSPLTEIIVTDAIDMDLPEKVGNTKITVLSMAPLVAQAIQRLHTDKSLSGLIL